MAFVSPLQRVLDQLHARLGATTDGALADYIPQLATANPDHFGICVSTVGGSVYRAGDAGTPFTIQSISKALLFGLALEDAGVDATLARVGLEPSGEAFNAISLEPQSGRPRNPMINAGAIAVAGLVAGQDTYHKMARVMDFFSRFVGYPLEIDASVYESERDTGHRNRAISYLLRNADIIGDDVDDVLDRYFRQCSILVTAEGLALMAATLANGGVSPATGERVMSADNVERVLSVMSTCGMYDYAGSWLYRVGMPAKSGVGGGIMAVLPGQLGIGVFSPLLDGFGNSVRGVATCEALSAEFKLHLLRPPVQPASVVLTSYSLADAGSKRRRSEEHMRILRESGASVRIFRLQGPLVFSTAEVTLRAAIDEMDGCSVVVFDCRRVHVVDEPITDLFGQFCAMAAENGVTVCFAGLREGQGWESAAGTSRDEASDAPRFFPTLDEAMEWSEDLLLERSMASWENANQEIPIERHPALAGLPSDAIASIVGMLARCEFHRGDQIVTQGGVADSIFLLTAGRVGVNLDLPGGGRYRIATIGPGSVFGEMALIDDQPRTAAVDAETGVVCYRLRTDDLPPVDPLRAHLVQHVARDLAARLRRADTEILALAH